MLKFSSLFPLRDVIDPGPYLTVNLLLRLLINYLLPLVIIGVIVVVIVKLIKRKLAGKAAQQPNATDAKPADDRSENGDGNSDF